MTGARSVRKVVVALAMAAGMAGLAGSAMGAVTVTASKQYVNQKVYDLRTNLIERIDNSSPGNYSVVSNAAMSAAITNAMQDAELAGKASTNDVHLTPCYKTVDGNSQVIGYVLGSQSDKVLASTNLQTGISAKDVTNIAETVVADATNGIPRINEAADNPGWAENAKWAGGLAYPEGVAYRQAKTIFKQIDGKQDALPYPTNAIPYSVITDAPTQGRYPLFVIDLNPGEARYWQHLELKATTNNFETDEGMTFFTGTTDNGGSLGGIVHDGCRLFIASKEADYDIRRWIPIARTGDLGGYAPLTLAIIVDPALFHREASLTNGAAWLYESNDNLRWSYSRIGYGTDDTGPEKDQNGSPCWRMVMPVKWFSELPGWATDSPRTVAPQDVVQYEDPWLKDIEDMDTSYLRFVGVTNVNQSVQFVTNVPNNVLNIELPVGSARTRDWVVYCNFETETPLVLPAATWWMADVAYTNAIPSNQPTALFFTQISSGVYMLSRQELTTVQVEE